MFTKFRPNHALSILIGYEQDIFFKTNSFMSY